MHTTTSTTTSDERPTRGRPFEVGAGFSALSFGHELFEGRMDPLVMVDHFTMSSPTFGVHPHAGISAVSMLFEDTEGRFHNRDSLGHDFDLEPGDLYWLRAGSGIVHDEKPRPGSRIHGLQIFVNLPAAVKSEAPDALLVRASDMPTITGDGARVRLVLGQSNGTSGAASPASPMTMLDVHLEDRGSFRHSVPAGEHAWVLTIRGSGHVDADRSTAPLRAGDAITVVADPAATEADGATLTLRSEGGAHLVVLQGRPLGEPIAERGGFVMTSEAELDAVEAAHAGGEFGTV